ncbi:MAG: adenylate/guanylate cyclase domain-containing protein, partial [Proteobacteria bacterium]|nr:adenylate/guanylate cyclase domain-containing protein [Pseudomonadota bacterium]
YQPLAIRGRFAGLLVSVVSYQSLSDAIIEPNNARLRNAYILHDQRYVLAHRNFSSINVTLSDSQPLPTIGQIKDPVLNDYFGKDQPIPKSIGDSLYNIVDVSGVQYFVVYKNISGYDKKPWLVGTYFPLSVVDAELDQIHQFRILSLTILFLGLAAAYFIGRRVTKPIRDIASAARASLQQGFSLEDGKNIGGSVFRELDDAAHAFNTMRSGLGHLSTYVPEGVTEQVLEKDGQSLVAEQHDVTVMFTDIVGFSTISAKLPAAEVAELLNIHFSLLADCVRAEGGTIDKYIGDSMMAFWLAREDRCDHAEKAFSAALAMASRLRMFNKERREKGLEPIRLRIGLHTGPVIVGNIGAPGRYNYTLIGDTVNVAERVEKLSKEHIREDQDAIVFVTKETLQCIGQETKEFSIGSHLLRGRGEPIEIFCFT